MNEPARKPNLENLLRKWWSTKQTVQGIEKFLEEHQSRWDGANRDLDLVEEEIGRAGECHGETLVYTLDGVTMALVWEKDRNEYTINLVKVREL